MHAFRYFFWFCSGANRALLKRCPTEASKYSSIGATVFFTGLLASLSAGYALYTIFDSAWAAVGFGLVWGTMIFNLDRFIVSSIRKRNRLWPEFKIAIPRIVLAVLLAIVISKPLELKMFEKEINRKIDTKKSEEAIKAKELIGKGFPEISELENKIAALKKEIADKETFRNKTQQEYDFERFGKKTAGTTGIPGIGTNAKKKEVQLNEAVLDLKQTTDRNRSKMDGYDKEIRQLQERKEAAFQLQKPTIDKYDGLAARIDALSVLSNESGAIWLANIFILFLFIALETAPIFVKLISSRGPYDELLEAHEQAFENFRIEKVSQLNHQTNERLDTMMGSRKKKES